MAPVTLCRRDDGHATHMVAYQITLSALVIALVALVMVLCYLNWRYWIVHGQGVKAVKLAQNLVLALRQRDEKLDDIEARLSHSQPPRAASASDPRACADDNDLGGPFVVGDDSDNETDDAETIVGTVSTGRARVVTPTKMEKKKYMPHAAVVVDETVDDHVYVSRADGSVEDKFWDHPLPEINTTEKFVNFSTRKLA
jgi:hypothetical protein